MSCSASPCSNSSAAAPRSSTTHSSRGLSYQKSGALACGIDTMRSTVRSPRSTSASTCSSGPCSTALNRLPASSANGDVFAPDVMSACVPLLERLQTVEQCRHKFADRRMDMYRELQCRIRRARRHDVDDRVDRFVAFDAENRRTENLLRLRIDEHLHEAVS